MDAFGSKLRRAAGGRLMFWCPGCDGAHQVTIREDGRQDGPAWGFNGDGDRPTFTPSILVRGTLPITDDQRDRIMAGETIATTPTVCHSFVVDGRIQFLGDCTHALAGQTVDLPDWEDS